MSVQATVFNYVVALDGQSDFPPNASSGTGVGTVSYDNVAHTLQLQVAFSGLTGNTTASHIHAPTAFPFNLTNNAGLATTTPTFAGFPAGVYERHILEHLGSNTGIQLQSELCHRQRGHTLKRRSGFGCSHRPGPGVLEYSLFCFLRR